MTYLVVNGRKTDGSPMSFARASSIEEAKEKVNLLKSKGFNESFYVDYSPYQSWPPSYLEVNIERKTVRVNKRKLRAGKLAALAEERWRRQVAGYVHPDDGLTYHSDPEGRQSLNEALTLARDYEAANGADTWSTDWKAADGWTTVDLPKLLAVARGVAGMVQGLFAAERAHSEALAQLTDPAEIAAYDVTTGWPG
jgi:hypothetical protein